MTRIVSVTWNAVSRDSRTFKTAASIARLGYDSVVVERQPSNLPADELPFQLITLPPGPEEPDDERAQSNDPNNTSNGESPDQPPYGMIARAGAVLPEWFKRLLRGLVPAIELLLRKRPQPLRVLSLVLSSNMRAMRRLPHADVYYLHSWWFFPATYIKSKRARAQLVYDAHDVNWEPLPHLYEGLGNASTVRMLESIDRLSARRATTFTTVCDGYAGMLEARFKRRPVVIRNFHEFRLDEEAPQDIRSVAGVPKEAFLLVMTGAPKPGDTVEQAFAAIKELPERVQFALVGPGQEQYRRLVEESGLSQRVHLLEPVPPTLVVSFIRTADASPILYTAVTDQYLYSLPNRFFHAIAAGLPVLYPPLTEMRSICEEHDLGIPIEPTDPPSIASAVQSLIEHPELLDRYTANARRAREVLSWEHEESILSELIDKTVSRKGAIADRQ